MGSEVLGNIGGAAPEGAGGGGIYNAESGAASIINSLIEGNFGGLAGGGIYGTNFTVVDTTIANNSARLSGAGIWGADFMVAGSIITRNVAQEPNLPGRAAGGGMYVAGPASVSASAISENTADGPGGGIFNRGALSLAASTVAANRSEGFGGGISNGNDDPFGGPPAELNMENVTISVNDAVAGGGGIANGGTPSRATISARNVTIAENVAPVGSSIIGRDADPVRLVNSLLAGSSFPNCNGDVVSNGHNLATDPSCGLDVLGDIVSPNPGILALSSYGGKTQTNALAAGSPAIDATDLTACPATDQRGVARPVDGDGDGTAGCDIGAYEAAQAILPGATPSPAATPGSLPEAGGASRVSTGGHAPVLFILAPLLLVAVAARWGRRNRRER